MRSENGTGIISLTIGSQVTALAGNQTAVTLAHNPNANDYLAVWQDNSNDPSGPVRAAIGQWRQRDFSANFDTQPHDQHLIVWEDGRNTTTQMYGQRINGDGTLAGSNVRLDNATMAVLHPAVAAANDLFIIGWGDGDLFLRTMSNDGTLGNVETLSNQNDTQQDVALATVGNNIMAAWESNEDGNDHEIVTSFITVTNDSSADELGALQTTTIDYNYDPLYRLTNADYSGDITANYSYVYDAVGNMSSYTETADAETSSVNRTFNPANQLQTATDTETGTSGFYYDDAGNLVEIMPLGATGQAPAGTIRYGFDQRNLLITSTLHISGTGWVEQVEYIYDGSNNRVQQIDYSGSQPITTTYHNDNMGLSQALIADDGTTQTVNFFGRDLIHQDDGTDTRILLTDGLGSARVEMVGTVIETISTYEPYGKLLSQTGTSGTVYGFTGEQEDGATGLVYLRARYYNPPLKVFMSRDPFSGWIRSPISQHDYNYVNGNPVNLSDPSGYDPMWCSAEQGVSAECLPSNLIDFQGAAGEQWTSAEKGQVNMAARKIGRELAHAYNDYMYGFKLSPYLSDNEYYLFNCGSSDSHLLTSREAFLYFYGGSVAFYKTGTRNGTAYGKYDYIRPINRSGIKVYTAANTNITSLNTGYRWATHELGHFFEARVNGIRDWGYVRNKLRDDDNITRRGADNNVRSYGFADIRYGWQQSPEDTTGEEFADMFLGWNYNMWEDDPNDLDYDVGQARADFMDRHMASWIALVINQERRETK